ncbi:MAG: universal stress protein [bacterium]|nr:universal stress protein [bacterium]
MYKKIYVPVDNSDYSNQAIEAALSLGRKFDSKLVGSHVYAATMHDYRFKQMEYTLPDEYLEETELERQRKIHDSLITMGLELISDSYLDHMKRRCDDEGLPFEPKMMDGKHHVEILKDIAASDYDLTVLGVMGIGRVRDSQIGSVCERVARESSKDVLVIKRLPEENAEAVKRDTILVGIDGSPQSFGALATAIELAKRYDKKIETISVYDPYLHYSVFNGVVNVLTEKAAKVFRFEEQNQLHEEIIDTGLAQIYQSHLDVAQQLAERQGVEITKTLLDGKAFQKILDHVRKIDPFLLVMGRIGVHGEPGDPGLGSNSENLLRKCPCDLLFTTRLERPELDVKAEESIRWTPEAEDRINRAPTLVQGIARTAIYRLAVEKGHSVITSDLIEEAMQRYMPMYTATKTAKLAEAVAIERARNSDISICKSCGVAAADSEPEQCGVCGGKTFDLVTEEMLERIAQAEGGITMESAYDGRKLQWSQDAKRALWVMKDAYKRRRTKARVEKSARIKHLPTITLEFARPIVEEELGEPLVLTDDVTAPDAATQAAGPDAEATLIARDEKNNPLFSALSWSEDAVERMFKVPSGFMRQRTQQRVEELAHEEKAAKIDLDLVERGIEVGRQAMEQMVQSYGESKDATPGDGASDGNDGGKVQGRTERKSGDEPYLNEVGPMSERQPKRR